MEQAAQLTTVPSSDCPYALSKSPDLHRLDLLHEKAHYKLQVTAYLAHLKRDGQLNTFDVKISFLYGPS